MSENWPTVGKGSGSILLPPGGLQARFPVGAEQVVDAVLLLPDTEGVTTLLVEPPILKGPPKVQENAD